jgi:hypothetical protein
MKRIGWMLAECLNRRVGHHAGVKRFVKDNGMIFFVCLSLV